MKCYKGCYIDNVYFHNTAEVDRFLEEKAVAAYKLACELFAEKPSMEHSIYCEEKADCLVNQYGYSYDQLEAIEAAAFEAFS